MNPLITQKYQESPKKYYLFINIYIQFAVIKTVFSVLLLLTFCPTFGRVLKVVFIPDIF